MPDSMRESTIMMMTTTHDSTLQSPCSSMTEKEERVEIERQLDLDRHIRHERIITRRGKKDNERGREECLMSSERNPSSLVDKEEEEDEVEQQQEEGKKDIKKRHRHQTRVFPCVLFMFLFFRVQSSLGRSR